MPLTFFDHRNLRIYQTSLDQDASIDLGTFHTDLDERRVGESRYDLLFTIETQIAFPKCKGLPRILPILYQTRDADFALVSYRIRDGHLAEILTTGETLELSNAMKSPGKPLRCSPIPYNPRSAEDAMAWAGVFSLKRLPRREMQRAIEIADQRWGEDWSPYCVVPWPDKATKAQKLRLEWVKPFGQNASFGCPSGSRECNRGFFGTPTLPLILYDGTPELKLFGSFDPQLIVTYCRRCQTIGVENQCD